jgi:hypothetical protein
MAIDIPEKRKALTILSWGLIVLVFALLIFIVVGPQLRNPVVDQIIESWRKDYLALASWGTLVFVSALRLRANWRKCREDGDLTALIWVFIFGVNIVLLSGISVLYAWQYFLGRS